MPDTVFPTLKMNARLAQLWGPLLADPEPPQPAATGHRAVASRFEMNELREGKRGEPDRLGLDEHVSRNWRTDLARRLRDLVELEDDGSAPLSGDEANSEGQALSDSLPSPFRWEPKRGVNIPFRSGRSFSNTTDLRRSSRGLKIPICPLHKQPFYRRFLFYLRRWLSSSLWQESDPAA